MSGADDLTAAEETDEITPEWFLDRVSRALTGEPHPDMVITVTDDAISFARVPAPIEEKEDE